MLNGDNGSEETNKEKIKKEVSVPTENGTHISGEIKPGNEKPHSEGAVEHGAEEKNNGYSTDPVKNMIENLKRQNNILSSKIKRYLRQIKRKEAKMGFLSKELTELEKRFSSRKEENLRLKRIKRKLEFRISTEARSLDEERSLVRQIEEINAKLEDEYKIVRSRRKLDHIKEDIGKYGSAVERIKAKISENDARISAIFNSTRPENELSRSNRHGFKKGAEMKLPEINLEDIAVIKKKEK